MLKKYENIVINTECQTLYLFEKLLAQYRFLYFYHCRITLNNIITLHRYAYKQLSKLLVREVTLQIQKSYNDKILTSIVDVI